MVLQLNAMQEKIELPDRTGGLPVGTLPEPGSDDLLGEMLDTLDMKSTVTGPLDMTAPWRIQVEEGPARFYLVTKGLCFLELDGQKSPVVLTGGDLAIITQNRNHRLYDHPGDSAAPLERGLAAARNPSAEPFGRSKNLTTLILGNFLFDHSGSNPLFSSLPALIHIKGINGEPAPWLKDLLRVIVRESASAQPGAHVVINQLIHVLFIQAVRSYIATLPKAGDNRLSVLLNSEIGPVLRMMHQYPEKNWTVAALAEKACLSRSAFAARFTALVGQPPLSYLFGYRMNKACHLLRDPQKGIKEIAPRVGYASEAAFSNAFKRWAGTAPGNYRFAVRGP